MDAGDLVLNEQRGGDDAARIELRIANLCHRASNVARALRPVAGHDDRREADRLRVEREIDGDRIAAAT